MPGRLLAALLLLLPLLSACERKPQPAPPATVSKELRLTPARFSDLPGWGEDRMADAVPALQRSCTRLLRSDPTAPIGPKAVGGTAADWREPCAALTAQAADEAALRSWMEAWFTPVQVSAGAEPEGFFTGYYEVELDGARTPSPGFAVPLYRRPPDLLSANLGSFADDLAGRTIFGRVEGERFVPYAARAEIDAGALAGRGLELLYLDDPVELFFMQIQGSGRVKLTDGSWVRLGYAAKNGHSYTSIGKLLAERDDRPPNLTMDGLKDWLRAVRRG